MSAKDLLFTMAAGIGLFAAVSSGLGQTWTLTSAPTNAWHRVASSADGSKLVAVGYGVIYTSTDSGLTWMSNHVANLNWYSVASSADGTKLVAGTWGYTNELIASTNSGQSWTQVTSGPVAARWISLASSADGNKLFAACGGLSGGGIYTSQSIPTPMLEFAISGGNLHLSWIVPSVSCVLQQRSDLTRGAWVNVADNPTLNLTNLRYQLTVSCTNHQSFYRLASP